MAGVQISLALAADQLPLCYCNCTAHTKHLARRSLVLHFDAVYPVQYPCQEAHKGRIEQCTRALDRSVIAAFPSHPQRYQLAAQLTALECNTGMRYLGPSAPWF